MLVVDLGGQYAQLIARRVRECRVYSELVGHGVTAAQVRARNPHALILSGGPASVYAEGARTIDPDVFELGIPTLGICYGAQLLALDLGGTVERTGASEFGKTDLTAVESELFAGLPEEETVWMSHRDTVDRASRGGARRRSVEVDAGRGIRGSERRLYGVQFHPEVVHTPHGTELLKNFLYNVAGAPPAWTPAAVIEEQVERIRAAVGRERVLCALSGGVDSAVAALLVHKAIGDQLTCVFVDHGLLRENEAEQVVETFAGHFHVPLVHVQAQQRFLSRLEGVDDPGGEAQDHRRGVHPRLRRGGGEDRGHPLPRPGNALFRRDRVGRRRGRRRGDDQVAPQRGRAAGRHAHGSRRAFAAAVQGRGAPRRRGARNAGGDGLAPAVPGPRTCDPHHRRRHGGAARDPSLGGRDPAGGNPARGLYRELWQSFAVLPAIRSVGVQGDERTYAYPIVIRAVTSDDAMTADWARLPYDLLETISSRIINEIPGVNRVALDLSSKPPATIEWE